MLNKGLLGFIVCLLFGFTVGFSIDELRILKVLSSVGICIMLQMIWKMYKRNVL